MVKQMVNFSLDKAAVDAMDVLAGDGSRTEWLRGNIRAGIERRLKINFEAIESFRLVARNAVDDGDREQAAEYKALILQYEAENLTLYKGRAAAVEGE